MSKRRHRTLIIDRVEELSWLLDADGLLLEKEAVTDLVLMRLRAYPERFHRLVDIGGLSPPQATPFQQIA